MIKKIIFSLYAIVIIVMAMATFVGNYKGQDYADAEIYGSWWFIMLWTAGVAAGIFYFIKHKERRLFAISLHLSFIIILAGALMTYLTAKRGTISLRQGEQVSIYTDENNSEQQLGFTLRLDSFEIVCHEGTDAAEDYISHLTILDNGESTKGVVSMNNIYEQGTMRLYQSSYDEDLKGSHLSINADPIGIPVTYTGYALLFISLIWMLVDKRGTFRTLLKKEISRKTLVIAALLSLSLLPLSTKAQTTLSREEAEIFSRLFINYNDRICPMETFALDFTKKLYGKTSYGEYSASQVLAGFMTWNGEWMKEPIIKIKNYKLREILGLEGNYASVNQFFAGGSYALGPYISEKADDSFHKAVMDIDDKLMFIMHLRQGRMLKIFPYREQKDIVWYSPVDSLPQSMQEEQKTYIRDIIPMTSRLSAAGDHSHATEALEKILKYQHRYGAASLPSELQVWAETTYNSIPFASVLFMLNLTLGFLSVFLLRKRHIYRGITALLAVSFLALTFSIVLRWIVKETIPMANGYETTLIMAWFVMLASLLTYRYLSIMTTFGLILSGFMLLVSHIGQMDPAITPRMPVLNSPLLSIHVSIIMIAYALLSLTFMLAIAYFLAGKTGKKDSREQFTNLSKLFLFPAMAFLGIGIFVGAIWANVSWGRYWGWDPKEVWALITFMIYAAPLHSSIKWLQKEKNYHAFMLIAFLAVLMTYFGVNYLLTGMHSYA